MFDDRPNYWDAWGTNRLTVAGSWLMVFADVEIHHLEAPIPLKFQNVRVTSRGPIRAAVVATTKYGDSEIEVEVCNSGLRYLIFG